jgi:hypothetical protein
MLRIIASTLVVLAACGGKPTPTTAIASAPRPVTAAERVLALLPDGAQLVVEIDLARLRANPVVGALIVRALEPGRIERAANLGAADTVVFASYGLGTSEAATVTLVVAKSEVPGATRIGDGTYALGPPDWVAQIEARAVLAEGKLVVSPELLALRDHAMPEKAPGASLRITARLPFDARISLARQTGIDSAPSQLSVWADVVDDLAIIVDADSADPGEKVTKKSAAQLTASIQSLLATLAGEPTARALGLRSSLAGAKLVSRGSWVRTIIAIGPKHLQRVVDRANALLGEPPKAPS